MNRITAALQERASQLHHHQAAEFKSLREHLASTQDNRALERQLVEASHEDFEAKVQPGCLAGIEIGNSYAGGFAVQPCEKSWYGLATDDAVALTYMHCSLHNEDEEEQSID